MALAVPKIAVLDSSTLGKVSRDYWSRDEAAKGKARAFLTALMERGVFIAFTLTHVSELLRHDNGDIVRDRLRFLRCLRLIAWLRPYDRTWFPGSPVDLLTRELDTVVHHSARSWREIIQRVRPGLWETGVGADLFVEDSRLWSAIQGEAKRQHEQEKYVASVARTRPAGNNELRLCDLLESPRRPAEKRAGYMKRFAEEMERQLHRHGDKRLDHAGKIASGFANNTLKRIQAIDALGGNPIQRLLETAGVPVELVGPETTVDEIGELAVYAQRLKSLGDKLNPPRDVHVRDIPPDTLPSYAVERRLALLQNKADRISGSDLGDSYIAPLVLYADGIEVDKRTLHHLKSIRRADPSLANLMKPFFRSSDYLDVPQHFDHQ